MTVATHDADKMFRRGDSESDVRAHLDVAVRQSFRMEIDRQSRSMRDGICLSHDDVGRPNLSAGAAPRAQRRESDDDPSAQLRDNRSRRGQNTVSYFAALSGSTLANGLTGVFVLR